MAVTSSRVPSSDQLEEENRRLHRAVEELATLNDLARAIGGLRDSQEIIRTIIHRSVRSIHAEQGVITMIDQQSDSPLRTLVRTMVKSTGGELYHVNTSLLGWMQLHRQPIMLNSPRDDPRFQGVHWDASIRSLICVPLLLKGEVRGVLTVYNKKPEGEFTEDDQRLLSIIAGQSAQVIENARLYESEKALLQMREELRLAARIQSDLLPQQAPDLPGYDIAGRTIAAQDVGGDYFDFIPMEGGRLGICVGDVSGKGLPASLLMANVQATLRSQSLVNDPPRLCIQRANTLMSRSTSPEKFVTLFYAVLDPWQHSLTYVNAGHEHPYHFTDSGPASSLSRGGTPLSMVDQFSYEEESIDLQPGDVLVIFSDGVTEAMNPSAEQFGRERLCSVIAESRRAGASVILEKILDAVRLHAGTAPQHDDVTIVVVRRMNT